MVPGVFAGILSTHAPCCDGQACGGGSCRARWCRRLLRCEPLHSQLLRDSRARGGVAKALGADRDERRADVEQIARVGGALDAAHPDHRNRDAGGDGRDLGERDGADRRCPRARRCLPEPRSRAAGPAASGASAVARSVLISDTASAPPCSAASAHAATSAVLGVSLTISGLAVAAHGAHDPLELAGSAPMSSPVLHVGARHVELDRCDLRALVARLARAARARSAVEPMTLVISGTSADGQRRGSSESADPRAGSPRDPCWAGRSS